MPTVDLKTCPQSSFDTFIPSVFKNLCLFGKEKAKECQLDIISPFSEAASLFLRAHMAQQLLFRDGSCGGSISSLSLSSAFVASTDETS